MNAMSGLKQTKTSRLPLSEYVPKTEALELGAQPHTLPLLGPVLYCPIIPDLGPSRPQ